MLNTFCPGRGSNQDLLRGSQTLYRVAIKAGLYGKAVQVCIIPSITTCIIRMKGRLAVQLLDILYRSTYTCLAADLPICLPEKGATYCT